MTLICVHVYHHGGVGGVDGSGRRCGVGGNESGVDSNGGP